MSGPTEVPHDLCHQGGFAGHPTLEGVGPVGARFIQDDRPEGTWRKHGIPGNYYTCADQANGLNIFPCTGSEHRGGVLIVCTCPCHEIDGAA